MGDQFSLSSAAAAGFQNAKDYDAHRPSYPPEAVQRLLEHLQIADVPNANVLEIAAGTGKFTEALASRHENYNIVAVEPHAAMRTRLSAKGLRNVTTLDGHAKQMPIESGWADACIAAQSFHWFATRETLDEICRVLKDKAVFGMIWNVEDYNKPRAWKATTVWEQKLNDWILSLAGNGYPRFRDEQWRDVFQQQLKSNPVQVLRDSLTDRLPKFSLPLGDESIAWTVWLSDDALWARIGTLSQVAILQDASRQAAHELFVKIMLLPDVERNSKNEVAVHGHTYFAWTDKI